jgi:leucyl-tRNA synthetase
MILGTSCLRLEGTNFCFKNKIEGQNVQPIHADVSMVNSSDELDVKILGMERRL